MVNFINGILGKFGTSLQGIMSVNKDYLTLHEMLMQKIVDGITDKQSIQYWFIVENAAYINTLVDMAYHLVVAILCYILYGFLLFFLYIIYLIAYPVRRKIRKENKKYQNGEVNHPYKRRRLLGSLIGGVRATFTAIICFSFLGSLIYIVTGGTNLPQRDQLKEEQTVDFENTGWNEAYDYYSYVCAMGNTGIFQVLNSIKDTSHTPFYFYFADIVLQGRLNDENLGVENEKFYLRDEVGEYVHFINSTLALMLKYGNPDDIEDLVAGNADSDRQMKILISTMGDEGFAEEFSKLIDEFDGKTFMSNLCLSALTTLVNHIDKVVSDEKIIGLVNQLFKGEDGIKVTDLATEADMKNLFKGLVQVVAEVNAAQNEVSTMSENSSEEDSKPEATELVSTKQMILIAKNFIPTIQELSLFQTRTDIGNKVIAGLYTYASTSLTEEPIEFDIPDDIDWIKEFNILLNACDPLLTIAYEVYDKDNNKLIENLAYLFERENADDMEAAFDELALQLESSLVLDVVFKSSLIGKEIDKVILNITKDETVTIPKNIDYVGKEGECSILLSSVKMLLKNGGGPVLIAMMNSEGKIESEQIRKMLEVLAKEVTIEGKTTTLIKNITESKLVYYMLSTYLTYADFGGSGFKLYLPESVMEDIEGCKIIKRSEIEIVTDLLSNCTDLIVEVMDHPDDLDYAHIFSNDYIDMKLKESLLLQGTLANVIIGVSSSQQQIILPVTYDQPESWINEDGNGEICILLDAIHDLSHVTIEEEKYLINELLNGNINPSDLLNLDKELLDQICSSKVLRYTISDMVTDLNGFEIVVARASLEEVNAQTTTDKLVNVIQASELSDIFVDIQKIVFFDEAKEMKINYNAIFENKAELSKSKTITATLIQLMVDKNEEGFLVIPEPYQIDFEKFKTDFDLTGNIWLGTSEDTSDDEIFLMLKAVETFIDKDENGKIPAEFNFETLQDDLKLRENGIDDICASAILNASLSNKITQIFHVPTELYNNNLVEQKDLNDLFKAIFKLFNRSEIVVKELDDDLFNLTFRADATSIILNSVILRGTITNKISKLHQISVPLSSATASDFINKESGYIIDKNELTHLFEAMFKILESDVIMVNDLDNQLTSLKIKKESISYITKSNILNATVSSKLSENNQIVILDKDAVKEEMLNEMIIHNIDAEELTKLLNLMFIILGEDTIVVDNISNEFNDLTIAEKDLALLLDSNIITATISHKLVEMNELYIPSSQATEEMSIYNQKEYLIDKTEMQCLLSALFVLFDTDRLEMLNLNSNLGKLELTSSKVDTILESRILQLTLSEKFVAVQDLVIPHIVVRPIDTLKNEVKDQIEKIELKAFFDAIFATTEDSINASQFELSHLTLPKTKEESDKMTKSIIVSAIIQI
ncbi:MAG: hypothetical protein K2I88_02175 [Anaeroplasmataceae bacterium]|nr:hypothetical protein [Anaeroplasmataceae bacterium]